MYSIKNGQTSVILRIKLLDSSSTVGAGLTGLTSASTGLIIGTIADNEATSTAYTVAGSTIESITTLGTYAAPTATKCRFKEVDSANHKGVYELQFADARFAVVNAKSLLVSLSGATNLAQADFIVPLVADDPYVAKPTNYASLSIDGSGRTDVAKIAGIVQTARDLGASVLLSSGTGAGQVSLTSGKVDVNDKTGFSLSSAGVQAIWDALTSALTTIGSVGKRISDFITGDAYVRLGAPAGASVSADVAAVKADTAAVKVKTDFLPSATAGAAGGVFIAGTNAATSITTALTANITGNLSGSVGSVTGNVNAVLANAAHGGAAATAQFGGAGGITSTITGNLTGSVASVTGAVGSLTTNNDKTGYALSAAGIQAVWDALTSALTTVGSIGKRLVDYLTGDIYARIGTPVGASISADIAAVQADTDNLQTRIPAALVGGRIDASIGAVNNDATSATNLARSAGAIALGTVGAGATTTSIPTSSLSPSASVADQYKGRIVIFAKDTSTAALRGQATDITANTALGVLTVTALTTAPASGDTFCIV